MASITYNAKKDAITVVCDDNFGRVSEEDITVEALDAVFDYFLSNGLSFAEHCEYKTLGKTFRVSLVKNTCGHEKIKEWINDFTKECDNFLANGHEISLNYGCGTYFFGYEDGVLRNENNYISFRVPGATRGGIKIVDNIIVDIIFDEEMCFGDIGCYKKEIASFVKDKFIGKQFDLPIVDIPEKTCSFDEICTNDKDMCDKCSRNKKNLKIKDNFLRYRPSCPHGRKDCINDPSHIKYFNPKYYTKLYGDVSIEEALKKDTCCKSCDGNTLYDDESK